MFEARLLQGGLLKKVGWHGDYDVLLLRRKRR